MGLKMRIKSRKIIKNYEISFGEVAEKLGLKGITDIRINENLINTLEIITEEKPEE